MLIFVSNVSAITYYTRSSGANWNQTISWSTVTYGGTAASAYPVAGDTVNIANGITVFINANSACSVINIGQGTSGILQYASTGSFTFTVSGNITVNSGATFWYNSNNSRTHSLVLGGNLVNNGIVKFVYDANDLVNITFNNATNSVVSGSGTWTLNNVTMNKSTATAALEVQSSGFEAAIVTFTATEGTYIHNNSGSYSVNPSSTTDFTINQNTAFKVPQGSLTLSGGANRLYLQGSLYVDGGNVYVGSTAGVNGIRYQQSGSVIPYLEVSYGTLTVYGGISYATGAQTNPFSFVMTGGTILLNCGSTGTVVEPFLINDVAGSSFYLNTGTIIIQAPNYAGNSFVDFGLCGNNGTVVSAGGTVQFGNSSTGNNEIFSFIPFANAVLPNFWISGPAGNSITLAPFNGTTSDFQLLSLKIDTAKTFDVRSYGGTNADSKNMTLIFTPDDIYGLYNNGILNARTGTVTFSSIVNQTIGGSANTSFYNLTINTSGYVTLASPAFVTNQLTMTLGNLETTSTNILTCTATASANIGSASSYVNGPMIHTVATASQVVKTYPIGKGVSYRPAVLTVTHSNSTSVTYLAEVINSSATALGYTLPATLAKVSYTRYWNFTRQNVSNFSNATMQLYYDVDDSVTNSASLRLAHDDGNSNWVNYYGTATANITGNITSTTISSFHTKFALGFPPVSLPVELIGFNAVLVPGNKVLCEWATASEMNNDYFTIERAASTNSSKGGEPKFYPIGIVKGAGNSTEERNYEFIDSTPLSPRNGLGDGLLYYRLRQTDFDGRFTLSGIIHIYISTTKSKSYTVFPNPSDGESIFINKQGQAMNNLNVAVHDMMGNEVPVSSTLSPDKKEIHLSIAPSAFNDNGMIVVSIISEEGLQREKVIIEK